MPLRKLGRIYFARHLEPFAESGDDVFGGSCSAMRGGKLVSAAVTSVDHCIHSLTRSLTKRSSVYYIGTWTLKMNRRYTLNPKPST